jgi:hypothetical protein
MAADVTIATYEPCPECVDGSCLLCGPASGEHAAPGVRLVVRRIRFVLCKHCNGGDGCEDCGSHVHPLATAGVTTEVIEEHTSKRWVPSIHLRRPEGRTACGRTDVEDDRRTSDPNKVTCGHCKGPRGRKKVGQ